MATTEKKAAPPVKTTDEEAISKPKKAGPPRYDEWLCSVKGGKAEKLKQLRKGIALTEEQATILNEGRKNGGNNIAKLYFLAS